MPDRMPKGLIIYILKRRFLKLNNHKYYKMLEVDWESLDDTLKYSEALDDFENEYPQFDWRSKEEALNRIRAMHERVGRNYDDETDSIRVELKLHFQHSMKGGVYAYVKGTIPK
jgi:hypothetical protein